MSLRNFHAHRGCLCCLPFIQGHLHTHSLNLQMKRGALEPVMASQVALPWWALIFVTAVSRNAHNQGCEDHIKWGVGPGVEVWTAVCGRAQGSTHLQINGLVLGPKIQLFLSSTHTSSHIQTTRTHTSERLVGCLKRHCYQHRLHSLVSAQEVMRAAFHSCLSLFSFSLLLPQMVVSTVIYYFRTLFSKILNMIVWYEK